MFKKLSISPKNHLQSAVVYYPCGRWCRNECLMYQTNLSQEYSFNYSNLLP